MKNGIINMDTCYVYSKENKVKVLDHDTSLAISDLLIKDGWKHTATLNSVAFIQYLANCKSSFEVIKEIHNLKLIEKDKI